MSTRKPSTLYVSTAKVPRGITTYSSASRCLKTVQKTPAVKNILTRYTAVNGSCPSISRRSIPLHAELEPLIRALTNDPHHQRFHDELLIKSRIFELMYRIFPYCETARKDTVYEDFVYEKLQRSLAFLEENYLENLTIKKMAAVSNYSESHFSKLFRELTGESFTQYLKNYRLDTGADRIRNEKAKISEIAMECGFSNLSYFSRSFCKRFGMTTSEFRRQWNNFS